MLIFFHSILPWQFEDPNYIIIISYYQIPLSSLVSPKNVKAPLVAVIKQLYPVFIAIRMPLTDPREEEKKAPPATSKTNCCLCLCPCICNCLCNFYLYYDSPDIFRHSTWLLKSTAFLVLNFTKVGGPNALQYLISDIMTYY